MSLIYFNFDKNNLYFAAQEVIENKLELKKVFTMVLKYRCLMLKSFV